MKPTSRPNCPICEETVELLDKNKYFPFCCKRCKQRDLGKWLDGNYSVAGPPASPHDIARELTRDSD